LIRCFTRARFFLSFSEEIAPGTPVAGPISFSRLALARDELALLVR